MKVQLLTYTNGLKSQSLKRIALALSQLFNYKVWRTTTIRHNRIQFKYGDQVDKLTQYKWFEKQGLSALEFTTDVVLANKWYKDDYIVIGRQTLTGSEGLGIVVFDPVHSEKGVTQGYPVYTKYKPKKREFRVHIFKNEVVSVVEKKRKKEWNGNKADTKIRNTANGYVFCQDIELTSALRERIQTISLAASKVCSSDFRGVDVGYNEKHDDVFVIEVNSAPGIEGNNVNKYVKAMKNFVLKEQGAFGPKGKSNV